MNWKGLTRKTSVVIYSLTCTLLTIRLMQVSVGESKSVRKAFLNTRQELREQKSNNPQAAATTPSSISLSNQRPFIFHASPISGIDSIMQLLYDHCKRKGLRCLSLQVKDESLKQRHAFFRSNAIKTLMKMLSNAICDRISSTTSTCISTCFHSHQCACRPTVVRARQCSNTMVKVRNNLKRTSL